VLLDEMVAEACLELPVGALDAMVDSTMLDADPLNTGEFGLLIFGSCSFDRYP
jgi:hypothetical protein